MKNETLEENKLKNGNNKAKKCFKFPFLNFYLPVVVPSSGDKGVGFKEVFEGRYLSLFILLNLDQK